MRKLLLMKGRDDVQCYRPEKKSIDAWKRYVKKKAKQIS